MTKAIKGGRVFIDGGFVEKDILLEGDRIIQIGNNLHSDEKPINASGLLVVPGLIDPHVHLREPGAEHKEDFRSGTKAAVAGGFTTVIDMPNNPMPTITAEKLMEKKSLASKKAVCDVRFHFGATDSNLEEVAKANPDSMKIYMGRTTGDLMLRDSGSLEKHFAQFDHEKPIVVHASDDSKSEVKNLEKTYSNEEFARAVAEKHDRRVHLAHVSVSHEIHLFKKFAKASCEAAPHYLFLNSKDSERLGKLGTVYPPLRSEQKRITLWNALDRIDCIATDHAPHTIEDKDEGAHGFPGLETCLGLMLDAHNKGLLGLDWFLPRMTENPAKIFNLDRLGKIAPGAMANLTLIDLKKEWEVKGSELFTKCAWSPFEGKKLKGKAHSVTYNGELIFEEGQFY